MEDIVRNWLSIQCAMMPGASRAVAVVRPVPEDASVTWSASWPNDDSATPALHSVATRALNEGRPLLLGAVSSESIPESTQAVQGTRLLANPLMFNGQCLGAVAVELPMSADTEGAMSLQLLRWGTTWFEFFLQQLTTKRELNLWTMLELVRLSVEGGSLAEAAHAATSELATRFACERVSLGVLRGRGLDLVAFTHGQAELRNSRLSRAITDAMREAIDQDAQVLYPPSGANAVTRQHQALASEYGANAICTFPLVADGKVFGALTLEHASPEAFDADAIDTLSAAVGLLGPILATRGLAERPWWRALGSAGGRAADVAFAPGHWIAKAAALMLCGSLAALTFIETDYRVDAQASVQGREQRAIVVPFDGYLAEAMARAGDEVQAGAPLYRLDDAELRLERLRWAGEKAEVEREYREALARHESAHVMLLTARLEQAHARLAQIDNRLERTIVRSPITGVVVQGDLSQSLGAPVERGQVLFDVAPLKDYRLTLELGEREIALIEAGQGGHVVLSGMSDDRFPFSVERIWPVSRVIDGRNVFRVEAALTGPTDALRPGMRGMAKVEIGQRGLGWVWTHRLTEQLRFWAWSWGWSR